MVQCSKMSKYTSLMPKRKKIDECLSSEHACHIVGTVNRILNDLLQLEAMEQRASLVLVDNYC